MEGGGWVHPSPPTPSPLPGKDPKYVWLVTDQGGREVVAPCQLGFPDPRLPSGRLFSESLGWGSGLSCLYHSHSVALGLCCGAPGTAHPRMAPQILRVEAGGQEHRVSPSQSWLDLLPGRAGMGTSTRY